MTKSGRVTVVAIALCAGAALSCGGSSSSSNSGQVDNTAWTYPESQYVINQLTLPLTNQDAKDLGFDLDGNGTTDNQLGNLLSALGSQLGDVQTSVDDTMKAGSIIVLLSIFAQTMQESAKANLWAFLGEGQKLTDGPQADGTYTVDTANSPADAYFGGRIKGGGGAFGGSDATLALQIPLSAAGGAGMLDLTLQAVQMEFDVSADGSALQNGKIGGAISETDINTKLIPQLVPILDQQLAKCAARMDGGTTGSGCGCAAGSGAATIQSMFDNNSDCTITADEVQSNTLVKSFLKGDVTLKNGEKALSMGIGFEAIKITHQFTHTLPPK
jgi:hypothetical protein